MSSHRDSARRHSGAAAGLGPASASEIASAGQTIVSLVLRRVEDGASWPLTRVLTAVAGSDLERVGVARALGDRHGIPLVHSQELRWRGHPLWVEARHSRDLDELLLELPAWDELNEAGCADAAWTLIDQTAAAAEAGLGSIGDGEPPETDLPADAPDLGRRLRRHLALLLPEWLLDELEVPPERAHRVLPLSALAVLLP